MILQGSGLQTQKRGRSKKTEGWTAMKNGGGRLAVSSYHLKRQCPPILPWGTLSGQGWHFVE